jgi:hypothetical protein
MQNKNGEKDKSLNPSLQSTIDFIVLSVIKYFFFVCIPLTTLSLARIFTRGFIPVMGLHIFLLIVLGFSFFRRKQLSSKFLSIVIVIIFFLLALGGFFTYYITIYLFPATVLSIGFAALLMSKRTAMISLFIEGSILLVASLAFSKTKMSQSIFEVLVYCVFSYFLVFAIDKVKISFLFLINSLKEKEIAEKKTSLKLLIQELVFSHL